MMEHLLTAGEQETHRHLTGLVAGPWAATAHEWEAAGKLPESVIRWCAEEGLLGSALPALGGGRPPVEAGLLYEALGRVSISLASLVNVHGMTAAALSRWGTAGQREHLLGPWARGERIAAIAMTEPQAGSDLGGLRTEMRERDGHLVLEGTKVYITFGMRADDVLVVTGPEGRSEACVVRTDAPGVRVTPMGDVLGLRAAGLARLDFDSVVVAPEARVGRPGFAVPVIVPTALEAGRHAVAWMALGMLAACFEEAARFARARTAFGRPLIEHGQIQTLLVRMGADLDAGRHLAVSASRALAAKDPSAAERVLLAKYFACRTAAEHTASAVQVLGSAGVLESSVTARAHRDAKVLSIIEGTEQILERTLAPMLTAGLAT
jgi:alkylation response protein AidB-like acyl-CoA dehydrogenase